MNTEVIMKRVLFGCEISQSSKTNMFSATDLVKAGNKWRKEHDLNPFNLSQWFNNPSTKDFINEIENKEGEKCVIKGRGRSSNTWVHPFVFIDLALAINPKLKIEVYQWIYDELIKYRNDSGDSYKRMCGSLYDNTSNKSTFTKGIVRVAELIKKACGVNDWQKATEKQLELRDQIHDNISLLCDVLQDNNQAIKIGIHKALNK